MAAIVVPFRGASGKRRLAPLPDDARRALSLAMLSDVLAACVRVGSTRLVTADPAAARIGEELGATIVADVGGGQGSAVAAGLATVEGAAVVVNADLPCALPDDVDALERATPARGIAVVSARDGTTNALGLSSPALFASLYGRGSAERFRRHARALGAEAVEPEIANLADDVDSLEDLARVEARVGPRTRAVRS